MQRDRKQIMYKKTETAVKVLISTYILMVTVGLPLYMKDGLVMLGDAKYHFFMRTSIFLVVIILAGGGLRVWSRIHGEEALPEKGHSKAGANAGRSDSKAGANAGGRGSRAGANVRRSDSKAGANAGRNDAMAGRNAGRSGSTAEADAGKSILSKIKCLEKSQWMICDFFVAAFGIVTVLSYLASSYRETAFWGYGDWYMGLVTQLLLVLSYFAVSRLWDSEAMVWQIAGGASVLVFLVGVLNRYCYDPLGVFKRIGQGEWNRLMLLSTIGNINWYCSYVCLLLPASLYWFWKEVGIRRILGGIGSAIGLLTLFTQGSSSGYAGLGAVLLILLWFSLTDLEKMQRFLSAALMTAVVPAVSSGTVTYTPRGMMLPDDICQKVLFWKGWWIILAVLAGIKLLVFWWQKGGKEDFLKKYPIRKFFGIAVLFIGAAGIFSFMICQWSESFWKLLGSNPQLRIDEEWGNGRGALWKAAVFVFGQGGWKQKLLGAGPDCYACIVYEMVDLEKEMHITGQWENAIFTNAHNEWLNMLVTEGLLGAAAYLGSFLAAAVAFGRRAEEKPVLVMGVMMIAGYGVNNFFSFQQIIVTPIVFVLLGMFRSCCKEKDTA